MCIISKTHPVGVCQHQHIFLSPFVYFEKFSAPLKITQTLRDFKQEVPIVEKNFRRLRRLITIVLVAKIKWLSHAFCNTYSLTIDAEDFHKKLTTVD